MPKSKNNSTTQNTNWSDLAKKIVYTGLGSAAMAHEVLKTQASKSKDNLMEILAREVSTFLGKLNVSEEITKALKGLIVNLSASIEFSEKKGRGVRPKTTIHFATVDKE